MLLLRRATAADVSALVVIARRAWLAAFAETAPASVVAAWRAENREPAWWAAHWEGATVALLGGVPVGVVHPVGDEVRELWVDPAAQGRGVGTALLRAAEREIAAHGHRRAVVRWSAFGPDAVRFLCSRGYRDSGREPDPLGGLFDQQIVFERALEAGSPSVVPGQRA